MTEYPSMNRTGKYFITAILLFLFQMILGLVMSFDFVLRGGSMPVPFDILKSLHLNVMVLWLLLGFIGGLYFRTFFHWQELVACGRKGIC